MELHLCVGAHLVLVGVDGGVADGSSEASDRTRLKGEKYRKTWD